MKIMIDDIKNEDPFMDDDLSEDDMLLEEDIDADMDDDWVEEDTSPVQGQKKKSFLSKYFNVILIGGVAVLGGGFVFTKFASSPAPRKASTSQNQQPTAAVQNNLAREKTESTSDLSNLRNAKIEETIQLPYEQDLEQIQKEREKSLLQEEEEENPLALIDLQGQDDFFSGIVEEEVEEVDPAKEQYLEALSEEEEEENVLTPMPSFDDLNDPQDEISEDSNELVQMFEAEKEAATTEKAPAEMAIQEDPMVDMTPEPKVEEMVEEAEETEQDMASDSSNKIQSLEDEISNLSKNNIELEKKLAEELKIRLAAERQIQELEEALEQSKNMQSTQAPQVKPTAPKTVKKAPQAKPVVKAVTTPKSLPIWTIRGAQNGQVTLYDQKSGDLFRARVGDNVSGLGRIQAIEYKDGNWFVTAQKKTLKTNF